MGEPMAENSQLESNGSTITRNNGRDVAKGTKMKKIRGESLGESMAETGDAHRSGRSNGKTNERSDENDWL